MTTPGRQAATSFEQMVDRLDDELCTWPAEPQVFTRANALDQWPDPITPLTQDVVELPQERGLEGAFVRVLGVTEPEPGVDVERLLLRLRDVRRDPVRGAGGQPAGVGSRGRLRRLPGCAPRSGRAVSRAAALRIPCRC